MSATLTAQNGKLADTLPAASPAKRTPKVPAGESYVDVVVPEINLQSANIILVGDSGLISHRWSDKARKEMLDKQMKQAKTAKTAKDPHADFLASLYPMPETAALLAQTGLPDAKLYAENSERGLYHWGFPVIAFKACATSACRFTDGLKMTVVRGAFHINRELVEIEGDYPVMREDMVRVGMGTADIRHRGEFKNWRVTLPVVYNSDVITIGQIVNLFNLGGFGVGVGEWRPEKDGMNGRFHVARDGE